MVIPGRDSPTWGGSRKIGARENRERWKKRQIRRAGEASRRS